MYGKTGCDEAQRGSLFGFISQVLKSLSLFLGRVDSFEPSGPRASDEGLVFLFSRVTMHFSVA